MSTIEEAREQAREALADFEGEVLEGQGSHAWGLADALRALLDATEPRPITDEIVEAAARASSSWKANRTDGYVVPTWEDTRYGDKLVFRGQARAALEAAEGARR